MYDPSEEDLTRAEQHINVVEVVWREHYGSRGLVAEVEPHENPMDKTEVYTFAFGLMASIVRTARAVVILTRPERVPKVVERWDIGSLGTAVPGH